MQDHYLVVDPLYLASNCWLYIYTMSLIEIQTEVTSPFNSRSIY